MRTSSRMKLLWILLLLASGNVLAFSVERRPSAVVCVGEALFDCIATERGISVKEMTERSAFEAFAGGATANVATACCKLGTQSAWIGCLGADSDGDKLKEIVSSAGVHVDLVQQNSNHPTRRVMVTRDKDTGDRQFGGFWKDRAAGEFADCFLDAEELHPSVQDDILAEAQWLVCGTLGLAYPTTAEAMRRLVASAQQSPTKLLVDVNWRPVFWKGTGHSESEARQIILEFIQQADVIKMTDEEVEWLLDVPAADALSDPGSVHKSFPSAEAMLVTAGEKGASYSIAGCTGFIPVMPVDVVETTGAGDAFTAGFLHQVISQGLDLGQLEDSKADAAERDAICEQLVRFASAVGGLTCTENGAIPAQPRLEDVDSFLSALSSRV